MICKLFVYALKTPFNLFFLPCNIVIQLTQLLWKCNLFLLKKP